MEFASERIAGWCEHTPSWATAPVAMIKRPASAVKPKRMMSKPPARWLLVVAGYQGEVERQRGCVLDLLHRERGVDVGECDLADQLLVEGVVGGDVGDD